jgi:dTDP-4-amino-4,6-dideoxygalactose transaminase
MKKIQMVDLGSQYQEIKDQVDNAILDVVSSSQFINGPEVKAFQTELEEYLDVKHVIPCANGTDALQVAMMGLGLKPGDEVITTNFTFAATVEVIALLGLVPTIVDVAPDSFNIDLDQVKKHITPKTKAIVPVHLFGQCADMEPLMELANAHNLAVIEDTAQAISAEYTFSDGTTKKAGTIGKVGTTSFFPSKNLGCYGDGGAIFTNDDELAKVLRSIVNHGMGKRYYYDRLGVNSRLDSVQAAVLRIKLRSLDQYCANRNKAANYYDAAFADLSELETPFRSLNSTHVFHQYTVKTRGIDRDALKEFLAERDVPAMIYYPLPLHNQEAYKREGFGDDKYPVTLALCDSVISLPMHTELSNDQLEYITESIKEFIRK